MRRILLIHPPSAGKIVMEQEPWFDEAFGTYAPLGLLYVATYLREKLPGRFDLKVLDCQIDAWDPSSIERVLAEVRPEVVGLSVLTPVLPSVLAILRLVKRTLPGCLTVLGGPHVSAFGALSLHFPEVDFAIAGHGEEPFARLMEILDEGHGGDGDSLRAVPNLVFRDNGTVRENPVDNRLLPLDDLPFPDRTLVDTSRYRCPLGTRKVMATLVGSRGCPFRCTFCNSPDKEYRSRSVENVMGEIRALSRLGIDEVFFFDDLFSARRGRIEEFCEHLLAQGLDVRWGIRARATGFDGALASLMRKAGCERIHFGIESHTDESLRALGKGVTIAQVVEALGACRRAGVRTVGSFMINLPGDTRESIMERFRFAESLPLDHCQYGILVAYDHCEVFDQGVQMGQWDRDLWVRFARKPDPGFVAPIFDNGIPRHDLDRLLALGMRRFYLRPGHLLGRLSRLRSIEEVRKGIGGLRALFSSRL